MSRYAGQELINERESLLKELKKRISFLETCGKILAAKEEKYRMALSKKLLRLPEIRAGNVKEDIAKGTEDIAHLRYKRDVAKVVDASALQSIYQIKIEIGITESDILHERTQR